MTRSLLKLLVLFCLAVPQAAVLAQSEPASLEKFTAPVVGVHDGDTLTVLHDGRQEKIRLYGVDAPETKQEFGNQAKQFTSARVFGKTVTVVPANRDRYGRTVAWIYVGSRSLNEELVASGWAWWYRDYARKETQLGELQATAQSKRLGLWAAANPIEPWDWRRGERERRVGAKDAEETAPSTSRSRTIRKTTRPRQTSNRQPEAPPSIGWVLLAAVAGVVLGILKRELRRRRR